MARCRLEREPPGNLFVAHDCLISRPSRDALVFPRIVGGTLGLVATMLVTTLAHADDLQQFELGKTRFEAGQYEEAASRFAAMLSTDATSCEAAPASLMSPCRLTDPALVERARTLRAASLVALGRMDEAESDITVIFRANPGFVPDPAAFPPEVIDRFTIVRGRLRAELDAEAALRAEEERKKRAATESANDADKRWIDALVKQASEQRVVVKNSPMIAALPFGSGQFQNGNNRLGWFFLISQAFTATVSIASGAAFNYYAGLDQRLAAEAEKQQIIMGQEVTVIVNRVAFGTWAALTVAGIVQAEVAFVPEKVTYQKRSIPPRPEKPALRFTPTIGVAPGSFSIGVVGAF